MTAKISGHLSESEMASMFGIGVWGLRAWRKRGYGPTIVKFGRQVYYREEDVQAFISSQANQSD